MKISNWFHIVAIQLGLTSDQLYDALADHVSRDALRDLVEATRKVQGRTIEKAEHGVNEIRKQRINEGRLTPKSRVTSWAEYNENSPRPVMKRPMALEASVTSLEQRKRFNNAYTGVYDLYRRESGPVAYIRDKLVLHRLFRNQFPVTLVSHVPDGRKPSAKNTRVYRGYCYVNNTSINIMLGRDDDERRFDLCSLVLHRTHAPAIRLLSGILASLTTSQGVPMAAPVVLCRSEPNGIDLDFPELWQSSVDTLVAKHDFIASTLKARQKALLGDKRDTMIAASAVEIERHFAALAT